MTISTIDAVGWIAYIFIACGVILIGKKNRIGWLIKCIGDLTWCSIGVRLEISSIIIPELISSFVDIYFFWRWNANTER